VTSPATATMYFIPSFTLFFLINPLFLPFLCILGFAQLLCFWRSYIYYVSEEVIFTMFLKKLYLLCFRRSYVYYVSEEVIFIGRSYIYYVSEKVIFIVFLKKLYLLCFWRSYIHCVSEEAMFIQPIMEFCPVMDTVESLLYSQRLALSLRQAVQNPLLCFPKININLLTKIL
jgi:hypothetical protein